jgi:hypothetical protein
MTTVDDLRRWTRVSEETDVLLLRRHELLLRRAELLRTASREFRAVVRIVRVLVDGIAQEPSVPVVDSPRSK